MTSIEKQHLQIESGGKPGDENDENRSRVGELRYRSFANKCLADSTARITLIIWLVAALLLFCARYVDSNLGTWSFVEVTVGIAVFTMIASFGQQIVIVSGGFDLSIAGNITLSGILLTALSKGSDVRSIYVVPIVLALGVCIGIVNGIGITILRIAPVVMTLGVYVILLGVVLVYTGGTPSGTSPRFLVSLVQGHVAHSSFPSVIIVGFVFVVLGVFVSSRTSYGRRLYALGSSVKVARLSGIGVKRNIVYTYAISGLCGAITGILLVGYAGNSFLDMGTPYFLLTLAAVVIGGTSTSGGSGYYLGAVAGSIVLATATNILGSTTLPEATQQILYGAVIVVGVLIARTGNVEMVA